jgi:hypothetical protein
MGPYLCLPVSDCVCSATKPSSLKLSRATGNGCPLPCRPTEGDVEAGTALTSAGGLTPHQYIQLTKLRAHFHVSPKWAQLQRAAGACYSCSSERCPSMLSASLG